MALTPTTSSSLNGSQQVVLLAILVTAVLACSCSAQNYHYSNGWYAGGKKRSSTPSASSPSSAGGSGAGIAASAPGALDAGYCGMRPEALALIEKIVQEEAVRMQKACMSSTPSAWQEYLESTARKLAGDAKW